jgi:hypothetical protein
MTRPLNGDRVGAARNDDRHAGKGAASPRIRARRRRVRKTAVEMTSCGNHKTVSTGLGNLAQNARFPHSHKPITIYR